MARPKRPEKKALPVKIRKTLYDKLYQEAATARRTLTTQLEIVLEERYAART